MPIVSYLAYSNLGQRQALARRLGALSECSVFPAENQDVVVLITDTPDAKSEEKLRQRLRKIEELACLAMVFAHGDSLEEERA
jgi:nitrate reductase NapAB chaperone NapD